MPDKTLNPDQVEAIQYLQTPLLIIAGAGTGKTTVITEKIKYLIGQGIKPEEILALTFTEKAAQQMEERVDQILPLGYTQMWIMTFHSFCDRILRAEGLHIGLDTNYGLLTQADSLSLLKKNIFNLDLKYFLPLGNPNKFLSALLTHFSRLADEDISPFQYLNWAESQSEDQYREAARAYQLYQNLKIQKSKLDFADLITYTLKLFRDRPNILAKYRSLFKYTLVDEFQDTNYAQNQLINLLIGSSVNLTVVADDDQSIYRFRGSSISNVMQFKKTFPNTRIVVLSQNYRSTQEILDRSYQLISCNNPNRLEVTEKINKKLVSVRHVQGPPVELIHVISGDQEADAVAEKIQQLMKDDSQLKAGDFAVLVRANSHAEPFLKSLAHLGIPAQFLGPAKLFSQPEVKDLIALLKVMADPTDDISLYRLLSNPFFKIDLKDLAFIMAEAKKSNQSLFTILEKSPLPVAQSLMPLLNSHLLMVPTHSAGQILYSFLEKSGILKDLLSENGFYVPAQAENITRLFSKIKAFENQNTENSVSAVLDWIQISLEAGESPAAAEVDWSINDSVNIMTFHSAKGLEFPVVFMVNLVNQRFPSMNRADDIPIPEILIKETLPEGDFHLQEERRLFYVGMTRARERLYLTAADYYGDAKRPKKLSPFITEVLDADTCSQKVSSSSSIKLNNLPVKTLMPNAKTLIPELTYLSYTQIQTFLDCPLHYKAKYILHLPTPPSAASTFGNIIHATLKDYYSQAESTDIIKIMDKYWISNGFENKSHEAKYKELGKKYLSEYVSLPVNTFLHPAQLEQPFTVPIVSADGNRVIKIGGKIDRIDLLDDGSIEIIDYKTGKPQNQKDIDSNLQLSFYALAARAFGKTADQIKLSLYFFDGQQKISTTRTKLQLDAAVSQIFDYVAQIEASDFACSKNTIVCSHCDFQSLCEVK